MANPANETIVYPFTSFNFAVDITEAGSSASLCSAAFAECDGLEMTMEVKTIRQGGDNGRQIRLAGPVSYGQLTLKRGMTANFDLWEWFDRMQYNPGLRADALVTLYAPDGQAKRALFQLSGCMPTKLKAPPLNAKDGIVAIEEFQMVYEMLKLKRP